MNEIEIGRQDYKEFCALFGGRHWTEIDTIVDMNHLSYGALKPSDGVGMVDINYKHILATIYPVNGIIVVNTSYEIYDDNDNFVTA